MTSFPYMPNIKKKFFREKENCIGQKQDLYKQEKNIAE